jgi:hypothetical protein
MIPYTNAQTALAVYASKLEDNARWRREKASQFPGDPRNQRAAELLDVLAVEVRALVGTPHDRALTALTQRRHDDSIVDHYEGRLIRSIGFSQQMSATEFARTLCRIYEHAVQVASGERALPAPFVDETHPEYLRRILSEVETKLKNVNVMIEEQAGFLQLLATYSHTTAKDKKALSSLSIKVRHITELMNEVIAAISKSP